MFEKLISVYVRYGPAKGKARIVKLLLPLANGAPVRSHYGVMIASEGNDLTNVWSISGGVYDDVYAAMDTLKEGMCFLDIGANAGVFSMVAAQRVGASGTVIAFEPSPQIFQRLIASASANRVSNFFPFQLALATEAGIGRFQSAPDFHTGTGHLSETGDIAVLQAGYQDIEALLKPIIADREVVLKIDVEGAECLVVRSLEPLLASGIVKAAIIEIDHEYLARFGTSAEEIYERFKSAGLRPANTHRQSDHYNEVFLNG